MERGLLSSPDLKPYYDQVVWFYLFQDFSHSAEDRQAERLAIRFGISSWPQHFLVDPTDLKNLGSTGRQLSSFAKAVKKARLGKQIQPSPEDLKSYDLLAAKIGRSKGTSLAKKHLTHRDVVVRFRAIEKLAQKKPSLVVKQATELLSLNHDQTRYLICEVLAKHGTAQVAPSLHKLLKDPGPSRNPNVVRCRAAQALSRCGDSSSLAALETHLAFGNPLNSLTRYCLDALKAIVKRHPKTKAQAVSILHQAFPKLPELRKGADTEKRHKPYLRLAQQVHELLIEYTGKRRAFPKQYDNQSREKLIRTWQ